MLAGEGVLDSVLLNDFAGGVAVDVGFDIFELVLPDFIFSRQVDGFDSFDDSEFGLDGVVEEDVAGLAILEGVGVAEFFGGPVETDS